MHQKQKATHMPQLNAYRQLRLELQSYVNAQILMAPLIYSMPIKIRRITAHIPALKAYYEAVASSITP